MEEQKEDGGTVTGNDKKDIKSKFVIAGNLIKEKWNLIRENKKWFWILCLVQLVAFSSIIRANFKYIDDLGRTINGYKGWNNFSRFSSCFLSTFVNADNYLTDISPLTQFMAILMLALTGIILIITINSKTGKKTSFWQMLAVLPIAISPYFLQNFSYKFDSPYMALSILASIIPLLFLDDNPILYFVVSFAGMLLTLTTYQTSTCVYPMAIIMIMSKRWADGDSSKDVWKKIGISVAAFLVGVLFYKLFIMKPVANYVNSSFAGFKGIIENYKHYFKNIKWDFKQWWLVIIAIQIALYIILFIRDSKNNKVMSCVVSCAGMILCILLMFGIYPALSKPLFSPRAMYGVGILISLIFLMNNSHEKVILSKIFSFIIVWAFIVLSLTYGNALSEQWDYTKFYTDSVAYDLAQIDCVKNGNCKEIEVTGTVGKAPAIKKACAKNHILGSLVWTPFCTSKDYWGAFYLYYYYNFPKNDSKTELTKENLPEIKNSKFYTIYGDDTRILVKLKS